MGSSESGRFPSLLVHLLLMALPCGVAYLFLDGSLFAYHASLLATAYPFLMAEGSMLAAAAKGRQRVLLLRCHLAAQLLATATSALGFAAIYRNKDAAGKPHFTTTHSYAGLATLALTATANMWGTAAFFRLPASMRAYSALVRKIHKLAGIVVVLLGLGTCVLGLQAHKPNHPLHKGLPTYVLACGLVIAGVSVVSNSTLVWKKRSPSKETSKGS